MTRYVVLQEQESDSDGDMYYFIKYDGNEESLKSLADQIGKIEKWTWEYPIYTIDMDHMVSEFTANEMCQLEINSYLHGKYNKFLPVDFHFKAKDSDEKMQKRVFKVFGNNGIFEYLQDEDTFGKPDRTSSSSETSSEEESSSESESESEDEGKGKQKKKKVKGLPPMLLKKLKEQQKNK